MNLTDIFENLLSEDFKNKKLLNTMNQKWFGDDNGLEKSEDILTKFFQIKDKIVPNRPEIKTFLLNHPDFNQKKLNDVLSYSLEEVTTLLSNYFEEDTNIVGDTYPPIFDGDDLPTNKERVEASKKLWYGKRDNLIYDSGDGFRIYQMKTMKDAINYGFYSEFIHKTVIGYFREKWCVTRRNSSNMWSNYRKGNPDIARDPRTFYFVIDESKSPEAVSDVETNKYYLSALQITNKKEFRVTSVINDGDKTYNLATLIKLYPKINNALDKIVFEKFNFQGEMGKDPDKVDLIDENETNKYCFSKVPLSLKKMYIQRGKYITEAISWETMGRDLKTLYIDMTEEGTAMERFGGAGLIKAIRSDNSDLKSVDRRLKIIGFPAGIGEIFSETLKTDYYPDERRSTSKPYISIFKHRRSGKMGIFDKNKGTWLEKNGIIYSAEYDEIDVDEYEDDEGNEYVAYIYSKKETEDNESFVVLSNFDDLINGHFISNNNWNQLKEKLRVRNEDGDEDVDLNIGDDDEDLHEMN